METMKLQNVSYTYKDKYQTVHALSGVSYEFLPGKFYAVVGKAAAGSPHCSP